MYLLLKLYHQAAHREVSILIQPGKTYFGRYIAGKLEEVGCDIREGIQVTQVREEL
jgi:hypothetical protein